MLVPSNPKEFKYFKAWRLITPRAQETKKGVLIPIFSRIYYLPNFDSTSYGILIEFLK
jgi:hypothetical protein